MTESLRGSLLISAPSLRDQNFFRTVILICEHDVTGSIGLVINREAGLKAKDAMLPVQFSDDCKLMMRLGGPVQTESVFLLHDGTSPGGLAVSEGISFAADEATLQELTSTDGGADGLTYRLYLGYAGWGAGQLEAEIEHGAWVRAPASSDLVFETESAKIWPEVLRRLGGRYAIMAQTPIDPELN
ncbi:MAG: YqgE/AlgH family protein [Planctomycetota bacterium]